MCIQGKGCCYIEYAWNDVHVCMLLHVCTSGNTYLKWDCRWRFLLFWCFGTTLKCEFCCIWRNIRNSITNLPKSNGQRDIILLCTLLYLCMANKLIPLRGWSNVQVSTMLEEIVFFVLHTADQAIVDIYTHTHTHTHTHVQASDLFSQQLIPQKS